MVRRLSARSACAHTGPMEHTPSPSLAADGATSTRADTTGTVPPRWRRYVAIGDSFTEGLWDVPGGGPTRTGQKRDPALACRGWADLLAAHLAERTAEHPDAAHEPFRYANLAIRGRLLEPIVRDQLPHALGLGPDLVSIVGGGNDLLRPAADPDALAARLETVVVAARATGADVLLATGMDAGDSPLVRRTRPRVGVLNSHVWSIARRHGAVVMDIWGMRSLRDWRMWAPDRIHLTTEGHRRVAQAALVALGQQPDDAAWDDPLAPLPPLPRAARALEDAEWLRSHVYPWARRRLRRRSSGDRRRPKQPTLREVR